MKALKLLTSTTPRPARRLATVCRRLPVALDAPTMAALPTTLVALCATAAVLLAVAEATKLPSAGSDNFSDTYVTEDGKKLDVADPYGDPAESDSIEADSNAEWQLTMVKGLYAQRKAEKDFIAKLEDGGHGLNAMVNNITEAFRKLEAVRQQRGSQLIKEHFENEIKLLKQSSGKILASMSSTLSHQSSDSAAIKALKAKVTALFRKGFAQQLKDEEGLFKKQMKQIEAEHVQQTARVKELFSLLRNWKDTFRRGLKKSEQTLEKISESWDML